jgi:hypothetical protein
MFGSPDVPSGFSALLGYCAFGPPLPVRAEPVLGD